MFNQFDEVEQKAKQMRSSNTKVLVHCQMGRSRSATLVIMYLIYKFKISSNTALEMVKQRRQVVDPNNGFLKQLKKFDQMS